jgi:hypothetical protein
MTHGQDYLYIKMGILHKKTFKKQLTSIELNVNMLAIQGGKSPANHETSHFGGR